MSTTMTTGGMEKTETNPMDGEKPKLLTSAKLCGAKTRAGTPCRAPAEKGSNRCRFHGARAGAPKGEANGAYKHGGETEEARQLRADARHLLKELRDAA